MKATLRTLSVVAVVTTFLILLVAKLSPPKALAQALPADVCSVASLEGGYGFNTLTGFFKPDANKPRFVPDVAAGLVVFDGTGHFRGKATDVTNGDVAPETPPFQFTLEGTYTLNSDCTGSLTEANSGTHLEIVVVDGGKAIEAIQTDLQETRTLVFKSVRSRIP
jgi:hypothetical protein